MLFFFFSRSTCPFCWSVQKCLFVLACHLLFASRGATEGLPDLSEVALLAMHKQLNCFVLLASRMFPCLRVVNVRLTLCACIVKYTTVHRQEMIICLQTAVYSSQHSPQQTCCSILSGSDQMAFSQKLIWQPLLYVMLNVCCWCCVSTWFLRDFFQPLCIVTVWVLPKKDNETNFWNEGLNL